MSIWRIFRVSGVASSVISFPHGSHAGAGTAEGDHHIWSIPANGVDSQGAANKNRTYQFGRVLKTWRPGFRHLTVSVGSVPESAQNRDRYASSGLRG